AGALTGDATMRGLVSSIRNELMGGTKSAANGLSSLSQLGITTDKTTGLLALDDKTWDKAAKTYGTGMASLFTGTDGLLSRMTAATDSYAVKGGVLESRQNILTGTLTSLSAEKESLDRRIATLQTTLTAKYTA
ncbi:flagellar filament capping protein FliD, partial [Pseudomonas umsongensis]